MELIDQTIVDANTHEPFRIGHIVRHVSVNDELVTMPLFASNKQVDGLTLDCVVMHVEENIEVPSNLVYRINQPNSAKDGYYPYEICAQFTVPDITGHYTVNFAPTTFTDYKYEIAIQI